MRRFLILLCVVFLNFTDGAPMPKKEATTAKPAAAEDQYEPMGIEYERYLRQVVEELEGDEQFRKKLSEADEKDIKSGKIAELLPLVHHNVRSKLNEIKRVELSRLIDLHKQGADQGIRLKLPAHLQHQTDAFDVDDLKRLIKQAHTDLEQLEADRKKEFAQHEMKKKYDYEQQLANLTTEERAKVVAEHQEQEKKHKDHPAYKHPGSEDQLKEVWHEQDHLDERDFDPKTFFKLHDLNNDNHLDPEEISNLFYTEIKKGYDPNNPEDDMEEGEEELARMKDHYISEADVDSDGFISWTEFERHANKHEEDTGWNSLESSEQYTPEEYAAYEQGIREQLAQQGTPPTHEQPAEPRQQEENKLNTLH